MIADELLPHEILESAQEGDWALDSALHLEEAARRLDLEDWIVQRLKHPEREMTVNLVLQRDNGEALPCTGFRVQHSRARGLCLGPALLSPDAHLNQLRAQAAAATWRWALLDLPLGGSAGALVCDLHQLSERELRHLVKEYVFAVGNFIGPGSDVLLPDGASPHISAWMLDGYARAHGHSEPGVVAGKPVALGGAPWLEELAGLGVVALAEEALAERKQRLAGARVALQGLGQVGTSAARLLSAAGARIVAVADASGGLIQEHGLDVGRLQSYMAQHRILFGYPDAEAVRNADVLEAACDVLITAAAERQITLQNAERIRSSIVIEALPGAITGAGERILLSREMVIVPDLLGCAGGPLASFLEWRQSAHYAQLGRTEAEQALRRRLAAAYRQAVEAAREREITLRQAAYLLAVGRVAAALRLH
jgi:glutamate dehydrogenase (NAD(P)+)